MTRLTEDTLASIQKLSRKLEAITSEPNDKYCTPSHDSLPSTSVEPNESLVSSSGSYKAWSLKSEAARDNTFTSLHSFAYHFVDDEALASQDATMPHAVSVQWEEEKYAGTALATNALGTTPVSIEEKTRILSGYIEKIQARRAELARPQTPPHWSTAWVKQQHYAEDEESNQVGNNLETFFASANSKLSLDEARQDNNFWMMTMPKGREPETEATLSVTPSIPEQQFVQLGTHSDDFIINPELAMNSFAGQTSQTKIALKNSARSVVATSTRLRGDFDRFCELPEKVRRQIWMFAQPGPRLVYLQASKDGKSLYSSTRIPSILHVCLESRTVGLKSYKLSFGSLTPGGHAPRVYFSFKIDGIYTRCSGCLDRICGHREVWTLDHEKVRGVVYEAPLSACPFRKIASLYPNIRGLMLIRGKSTVDRSAIDWEDFRKVDENFEWQFGALVEAYKRELTSNGGKYCSAINLKSAKRVTLPNLEAVKLKFLRGTLTASCY